MAITWGTWKYAGGNGMRVGLDISWSGVTYGSTTTTATVEVWTDNQYTYNDNQAIDISSNLGSNFSYNNTQGATATKRGTRTYTYTYGTNPGTVTFSATVTGTYNGVSPTISVASATPTVPTPSAPGAPSISASPGNGFVDFTYSAPTDTGTGGVSYYQSSPDNSSWSNNPANPFRYTGSNGTSISGYIRAVNAYGQAGPSASASATPRTVPSAPTSFAATANTFGTVALSWVTPNNGGNAISSYTLTRTNGATTVTLTAPATTATTYNDTTVDPAVSYTYTLLASNAAGNGATASVTITSLGGIARIWNGTAYVATLPKVWNGTAWIDAQARMWNGTEWKHGI